MSTTGQLDPKVKVTFEDAKIKLATTPSAIFLSSVLFSLKTVFNETIETACVDGVTMTINPDFWLGLTKEERVFLLVHETYHVVFMHMERAGNRIFRTWNAACDFYINLQATREGFTMPKGGLLDSKYADMSAYEIYDALVKDPSEIPKDFKEDFKKLDLNDAESKAISQEIENIVVRASIQAQQAGKAGSVPADVAVYIDALVNPKLPWNTILANHLNDLANEDYSYRRFNRRFLPDYYLPSLYSESIGEIVCCVDVSGSVTRQDLTEFISEVRSIYNSVNPKKITIIAFDTKVTCEYDLFDCNDIHNLDFKGGGGTDIDPVFDWTAKRKTEIIIIFTDGEFWRPPTYQGNTKIIWIIKDHPSFTAERGTVIHY